MLIEARIDARRPLADQPPLHPGERAEGEGRAVKIVRTQRGVGAARRAREALVPAALRRARAAASRSALICAVAIELSLGGRFPEALRGRLVPRALRRSRSRCSRRAAASPRTSPGTSTRGASAGRAARRAAWQRLARQPGSDLALAGAPARGALRLRRARAPAASGAAPAARLCAPPRFFLGRTRPRKPVALRRRAARGRSSRSSRGSRPPSGSTGRSSACPSG